tara:strand:- start:972 stop:1292 length:321 start_codon:yes stop_codon:yes gene_type:complete
MCNFLKIIKYFRKKINKKVSRESTYLETSLNERSLLLELSSSSSKILLTDGVPVNNLLDLLYKRDYKNNPLLMESLSDGELSPPSLYLGSSDSNDSLYLNDLNDGI